VVPPELLITFDCRIPPEHVNVATWEETVNQWCKEAGVWVEYPVKQPQILPTKLDNSNIYWVAFKKSTDKLCVIYFTKSERECNRFILVDSN
jgi:aminoacylase